MRYTHAQRTLVVIITAILFMVSVGIYYYLYTGREALIEKTQSSRRLAKSAESTRSQGKEIMSVYENTKEMRSGLSSFFVPTDNAVTIIQSIEAVGTHSGATVSLSSIKSTPPTKNGEIKTGKITVAVSVTGSWSDVMKALQLFETLPFHIVIEKINLNSAGTSGIGNEIVKRWQLGFDLSVLTMDKVNDVATTTKK
jgi:Tfp pilus assembly protein PilO